MNFLNFLFAWRYFKAKKSTQAINIIAWISIVAMTVGTAALLLVLSVFNGFEGLVKSLYSTFYTDLKIFPATGKVLVLTPEQLNKINRIRGIKAFSLVAEEKGILQHAGVDSDSVEFNFQSAVTIKGVDNHYPQVAGVPDAVRRGEFNIGNADTPMIVLGSGVEDALQLRAEQMIYPISMYLPRKNESAYFDPAQHISNAYVYTAGVFEIQQDFDNNYAFTNLAFVQKMLGLKQHEYSGMEIALANPANVDVVQNELQQLLGPRYLIQSRFEQNRGLYAVMQAEKWVIYAVLVLIMIIFSFTIISSLTMLVIEKQKDISVLTALGGHPTFIQKIFLSEGLLIGIIGGTAGIILAVVIAWLQLTYKLIPLQGGSFLIDYFPVELHMADIFLVVLTVLCIAVLAAWIPSRKAARQEFSLRSE